MDPEIEFLNTAVSSCRSTIVQQEAELKKLKESLNVRNKRVIQLESQIVEATSHIASRHTSEEDSVHVST